MSMFQKRPSGQEELDESVYRPKELDRMELPADDQTFFQEAQPFDHIWLWAFMGIELLVLMIPLVVTGQPFWVIGIAAMVMALTFAFLGSLNLRTRIDHEGVHYRMSGFQWSEKTIPWEDIDQIYVRKYSPLADYGGWGIKYGPKGKAFNVRGNYGIQIVRKNGKRFLLGTQKPDEVAAYLSRRPLLV